jgi:hypothetical protein
MPNYRNECKVPKGAKEINKSSPDIPDFYPWFRYISSDLFLANTRPAPFRLEAIGSTKIENTEEGNEPVELDVRAHETINGHTFLALLYKFVVRFVIICLGSWRFLSEAMRLYHRQVLV